MVAWFSSGGVFQLVISCKYCGLTCCNVSDRYMWLVLFQRCGIVHDAGVFCCIVLGMSVSLVSLQSAGLTSLVLLLPCDGPVCVTDIVVAVWWTSV